jgi:hypothetical protein
MKEHVGNRRRGILFDQLNSLSHPGQLLRAEGRDVSRIGLGEDEAPFSRSFSSELDRDYATACQQLSEGIAAAAFFRSCHARSDFLPVQIAGSVEQVSKLVIGSCSPACCGAASLRERLLDRFQSDVIAPLTAHYFVEKRAIQRQ